MLCVKCKFWITFVCHVLPFISIKKSGTVSSSCLIIYHHYLNTVICCPKLTTLSLKISIFSCSIIYMTNMRRTESLSCTDCSSRHEWYNNLESNFNFGLVLMRIYLYHIKKTNYLYYDIFVSC